MAPARLRALEVDATTIPQGPGLAFSGGGRDQRPAQTAVCTRYAPATRLYPLCAHRGGRPPEMSSMSSAKAGGGGGGRMGGGWQRAAISTVVPGSADMRSAPGACSFVPAPRRGPVLLRWRAGRGACLPHDPLLSPATLRRAPSYRWGLWGCPRAVGGVLPAVAPRANWGVTMYTNSKTPSAASSSVTIPSPIRMPENVISS
jgi:hypothetical protein